MSFFDHKTSLNSLAAIEMRRNWVILEAELQLGAVVGRGAVGIVHRGWWRDMAVAVKVVQGQWQESATSQAELDHEANALSTLRPHC